MRHRIEVTAIAGTAVALALVAGFFAPGRHAEAAAATAACATAAAAAVNAPCCFTNPSYSGVCQVQPAKDETCASILSYLNNPMSAGKAYCDSTPVRGGWRQVACAKKTPADMEPQSLRTLIAAQAVSVFRRW